MTGESLAEGDLASLGNQKFATYAWSLNAALSHYLSAIAQLPAAFQAAVTGESLVEGDLASLAQRNPSKFQRLNQRMTQVGGVPLRA